MNNQELYLDYLEKIEKYSSRIKNKSKMQYNLSRKIIILEEEKNKMEKSIENSLSYLKKQVNELQEIVPKITSPEEKKNFPKESIQHLDQILENFSIIKSNLENLN